MTYNKRKEKITYKWRSIKTVMSLDKMVLKKKSPKNTFSIYSA